MSNNGRQYQIDFKSGRKFWIETIDNSTGNRSEWGDLDPATKKVTGSYGLKYKGGVTDEESIITKENGFKNITTIGPGESPDSFIKKLLKE